ncbi:hypothetical protein [Pseudomonas syringae]|uniref:hypothetical protein n=1 Tax=Pseudomonas syringae TaxID=317 RepID=UPI00126790A9|nr:hypothetical protein [Pseudomonas syringae]
MKSTTAYSPVTQEFALITQKELREFYDTFMLNIPYCLDDLIHEVWRTPGFEDWSADFNPSSLDTLGEWIANRIMKNRLNHKKSETQADSKDSKEAPERKSLTDEELALAVSAGMYYGEVSVKSNPALHWEQLKGGKRNADYGQPVILGKNTIPINPIRIANVFMCGVADGSKTSSRLRETYDYWMTLIQQET